MREILFILVLTCLVALSFCAGYSYARMTESSRRLREAKAKLDELYGDG